MDNTNKCAHCDGTGTCKNGVDETSCMVCVKKAKLKIEGADKNATTGLVCSVCGGHGISEPYSSRLQNRIVPLLAIIIVYIALLIIWSHAKEEHFNQLLAFASTLIGSVTGYYFGGKNK